MHIHEKTEPFAGGSTVDLRCAGAGVSPAQPLARGARVGRYEISRRIGEGGMGTVYEAVHGVLQKRVALKTLRHVSVPEAVERFTREAQLLARVAHPHVVSVLDAGVEGGVPFLAMEYLEGEDLAQLLGREGRLSPERAVDLVLPLVSGLSTAHRLGVVHRDIKPENVVVARDAHGNTTVKLIDFGVSSELQESPPQETDHGDTERVSGIQPAGSTRVSGLLLEGTPHYMAPELVRGSAIADGRSDQYALGVLLYQCLCGARPFEADSLVGLAVRIHAHEHEPLRERCPELPAGLVAVVERAMSGEVDARFPDLEALGRALLPFASEEGRRAYQVLHPDVAIAACRAHPVRLSARRAAEQGHLGAARGKPLSARLRRVLAPSDWSPAASTFVRSALLTGLLMIAVTLGLQAWHWATHAPSLGAGPAHSQA